MSARLFYVWARACELRTIYSLFVFKFSHIQNALFALGEFNVPSCHTRFFDKLTVGEKAFGTFSLQKASKCDQSNQPMGYIIIKECYALIKINFIFRAECIFFLSLELKQLKNTISIVYLGHYSLQS
jgi:hypothetical protein